MALLFDLIVSVIDTVRCMRAMKAKLRPGETMAEAAEVFCEVAEPAGQNGFEDNSGAGRATGAATVGMATVRIIKRKEMDIC